ncbi:Uncharacterized protein dnm_004020 [Desulfonema magnum]|uniref:Uncharacterized protein n=1 Tax=Desulfonema magnum TaxID=45655 RepID=A0A975BFD3_9BACT|nr:Uncharacterized protein dnm_004020 [Desulfonema magnum]
MNGGETRLFPLRAAAHSGKKAGFLSRANIEDLWLGTYILRRFSYADTFLTKPACREADM